MLSTISVAEFKTDCLALLDKVKQTGVQLVITEHGQPIAQLVPIAIPGGSNTGFGCMLGTFEEVGDIVEPLGAREWVVAAGELD